MTQADDEIERVCRDSYGRIVALLASRCGDIASAEDGLAEAFGKALVQWRNDGVPKNPEAWLVTVARRLLIDQQRSKQTRKDASDELRRQALAKQMQVELDQNSFIDERLKLFFVCAHPAIDSSVRAPLILQTLLGLNATTIGSAFLVAPKTMGQRLSRAKRKILEAGIAFRIPETHELNSRLQTVSEAIYAAFGLGWDHTFADTPQTSLTEEAISLARILHQLLPSQAEPLGLLSLMLFSHARRRARRSPCGRYVPLSEHDLRLWDHSAIDEAEHLLIKASALNQLGPYQLEAAIQSAYCACRHTRETDWSAVALLYDGLAQMVPGVGVRVAQAAALSEAGELGPASQILTELAITHSIDRYQPYWAVKASLLTLGGDIAKAQEAYERAIGLTEDHATRQFLIEKRRLLPQTESGHLG